jgi:hypothetical protein
MSYAWIAGIVGFIICIIAALVLTLHYGRDKTDA